MTKCAAIVGLLLASAITLDAQRGGRGGPPAAPRDAAAIDLTGYWVSVITEDWKFRMVTPKKGVYETLPLNAEGRKLGDSWDPARDEAAGEQCRAYGAANIMRMPTRLHVTWEDANTLRIDTDAGTQTRRRYFAAVPVLRRPSTYCAKPFARSWSPTCSWSTRPIACWVWLHFANCSMPSVRRRSSW